MLIKGKTKPLSPARIAQSLVLALTLPTAAYVQAASLVEGTVQKAAGTPLAGALVKVQGQQQQAYTDEAGRFTLRNLAAGQYTLEVSYIGLPTQSQSLTVSDTGVSKVQVLLNELERMAVVGQRQAQNKALNQYRASDAVTNFIASDDMGQFVDQNVAESLQRLPGTSISRDQGEGRFVSIRGISAGLSAVTVNGMRMGTPESGSRAVPLDVIPTGSIEGISVTKAPTPDMPGDAIGGTVDVKSASAFDRGGRHLRYRAEASYNDLSGETSPKLSLNASDLFSLSGDDDDFGVAFGANFLDRKYESDNIEAEYDMVDTASGEEFGLAEVQQRKYFVNRERLGLNLDLEWRPSDTARYFSNTVYSRFTDHETRQRSIFTFADAEASSFDGETAVIDEMPADAVKRRIRYRSKEQDTLATTLGGKHQLQRMNLDYHAGMSTTRERVLDENEGRFEYAGDDLQARYRMGSGIPSFEILDAAGGPTSVHLNNADFELDRAVLEPKRIDDDEYNIGGNLEIPYAFGNTALTLKTGADLRWKDKDSNVDIIELRRTPDATLDQFTTTAPSYGLGNIGQGISSKGYIDFFNQNRSAFTERPQDMAENTQLSVGEDFVANEDVQAAYLMATYDADNWRLIAGTRVERTDYSADGHLLTFDEDGELAVEANSVSNSYTNWLPGLHFSYDLSDDLKLRAAWTNTIARPSFNDISPRVQVDLDGMEVELANPDLKPYEAMNYDLLLDWYYADGSLLSAGVFYKDIDNFIVETTSNNVAGYEGFEVTRPENAVGSSVKGLELNWQHSFAQPMLSGVLLGSNFSWLDTELTILSRPGESFSLPESAEKAGNFYVGYEDDTFSTRLSLSYRDKFLSTVGEDSRYDIYTAAHTQLDLTASYKLWKELELVAELVNLTDEPLELYQGNPGNTLQFEEYGMTMAFGVKGKF